MPTITNVIPAIASTDQGVSNSEFPGCRLPLIDPLGVFWNREAQPACASCSRNFEHKQWRKIGIWPASNARAGLAFFSDLSNTIRDCARKLQSLIRLMHMTAWGVVEPNSIYSAGGYQVATVYGGWTVVSASGNLVTCTYTTGSANPSDITWSTLSENPEWGQPDGSGGLQGRWINSVFHGSIPGGRGLFKLSGNSQLSRHPGWIVRRVSATKNIAVGNNFTIEVDSPIGGLATTLRPGTSAPITGGITLYTVADEPWTQPRDSYPFWSYEQVTLTPAPFQTIQTLASYAIKPWQSGGTWNPIGQIQVGGVWSDDAALSAKVFLDHQSGGATVTKIDLTDYVLAPLFPLRILGWKQDAGAGAGAVIVGQDRCARSVYDPTSSNGVADANGKWHYCSAADALRAIGEADYPDVHYKPACMLTRCPFFQHDAPSHPFDPALWHQLIWGIPWKVVQRFIDGGVDNDVFDLYRNSAPGLAALVKGLRNCPTGYHAIIDWQMQSGGWPQFRDVTVAGEPQIVHLYGLEWLEKNDLDAAPNYWDTATWPDFGPAGNKWAKKVEHSDAAASDANDPKKMQRQRLWGGGRDTHRYSGAAVGGIGRRHRFSPEKYELWFPRLLAGNDLQTYDDGTFQRGAWDVNFVAVDQEAPEKVYGAKITTRRLRYGRDGQDGHGGDVASVRIKSVALDGAGVYKITLSNGTETASSLIGGAPRQETATQWRAGQTNVQAPEFGRLSNYGSANATVGVNRGGRVEAGHALVFTHDSIPANSRLKNRRLLISKATAASSATTESWRLDVSQAGQAYYDQGYYFLVYGTTTETATALTVTRNGGATALKIAPGPSKLYGLAKDTYQWFEGINSSGQKGMMIYFSPKNGTGTDADRVISITVQTTAATYGPTLVNLETDLAMGWNGEQVFSYTTPNGETVSSMQYARGRKQTGEAVDLSAWTAPATWAGWDLTHYSVSGIGTSTISIRVSPDWAGDNIEIMCNLTTDGLTDDQYRDQRVGIHQGLPAGYTANGNKCDEIWVVDEAGAMADHLARIGATSLDNLVLPVSSISFMEPGTAEIIDATPDDGGGDAAIDAANYGAFCAAGEFYIKIVQVPAMGHCAIVKGKVGVDQDLIFASEIHAVRQALETMLFGDGG